MTDPSPPPGTRRRSLEGPVRPDSGNRAGCMITGAVLGIIVGLTFAFYGLPPILRSIYGETKVAAGATYEGDAKVIRVVSVDATGDSAARSSGGSFVVTLSIRTNKTWAPELDDFRLELTSGGDWLKPLPPAPADTAASPDFVLGQERTLILRYARPDRVDIGAKALHLSDPRVRFELPR